MDMTSLDQAVVDHAAGLFLRYFGNASSTVGHRPAVQIERDREMLRLHWAISPVVLDLATYVFEHRHEIQSILGSTTRVEDGMVRGRLDPVATIRLRRVSGLATAVVSREPTRSYASGPNQVLLWVLTQAWNLGSRFKSVLPPSASYQSVLDEALQRLTRAHRLQSVMRILDHTPTGARPSASALLEAGRSRRELYRRAADAYRMLVRVEAGDANAIAEMLRATLLAPLEPWRRYELLAGYAAGEVLAELTGTPLSLGLLVGDNRAPVCRAGRYAVYWQWTTGYYKPPQPEPSEVLVQEILDAYGMPASADRPDLVVIDQVADQVVAVIEVKYLTGEDAADRARSAFSQVVRYARGYRDDATIRALLAQSLVVVSQGLGKLAVTPPAPVPSIVDFEGIRRGELREWAARLAHCAA